MTSFFERRKRRSVLKINIVSGNSGMLAGKPDGC